MNKTTKELKKFLDTAHSVYHAVAALTAQLDKEGYTRLTEQQAWELTPGGKYYLTRGGTAVLAFRIPKSQPVGFMFSASHSDRPTFKFKENG